MTVPVDDSALLSWPLGKPATPEEAMEMLKALRGRWHLVVTGVALVQAGGGRAWQGRGEAWVLMREYSDEEIRRYVERGEPCDKAGGYAVQDPEFSPARRVRGCYTAVVGLPLCVTARLLAWAGFRPALPAGVGEPGRCPLCNGRPGEGAGWT